MSRAHYPSIELTLATALALLLCCAPIAGCGSSTPGKPPGKPTTKSTCDGARSVAEAVLRRPVRARILATDPANLECRLSGSGIRVQIVSQTSGVAYTAWNTEVSHQEQVYGPGIHRPGQIPRQVSVSGATVAVWIPAQRELVATSGKPTSPAGTYLTVTTSGRRAHRVSAVSLARAVAATIFRANSRASS